MIKKKSVLEEDMDFSHVKPDFPVYSVDIYGKELYIKAKGNVEEYRKLVRLKRAGKKV